MFCALPEWNVGAHPRTNLALCISHCGVQKHTSFLGWPAELLRAFMAGITCGPCRGCSSLLGRLVLALIAIPVGSKGLCCNHCPCACGKVSASFELAALDARLPARVGRGSTGQSDLCTQFKGGFGAPGVLVGAHAVTIFVHTSAGFLVFGACNLYMRLVEQNRRQVASQQPVGT